MASWIVREAKTAAPTGGRILDDPPNALDFANQGTQGPSNHDLDTSSQPLLQVRDEASGGSWRGIASHVDQ